jgi:tripartite-type tricarboxylate transporter receptor subunit TctC
VQSRGGVGIINIATTQKNGLVVGVSYVQEGDELLLITQQGMILRMATDDVRAIGRATQGVTLINIEPDDKVVSIARLVEKEDEDPNGTAPAADRSLQAAALLLMVAAGACAVVPTSSARPVFRRLEVTRSHGARESLHCHFRTTPGRNGAGLRCRMDPQDR